MLLPRSLLMMLLVAGLPRDKLPCAFVERRVYRNSQGPQAALVALIQGAGVKLVYVLTRGVGKCQHPL